MCHLIEIESEKWNYFSTIPGKYLSNNKSESSAAVKALAPAGFPPSDPQKSTIRFGKSVLGMPLQITILLNS